MGAIRVTLDAAVALQFLQAARQVLSGKDRLPRFFPVKTLIQCCLRNLSARSSVTGTPDALTGYIVNLSELPPGYGGLSKPVSGHLHFFTTGGLSY